MRHTKAKIKVGKKTRKKMRGGALGERPNLISEITRYDRKIKSLEARIEEKGKSIIPPTKLTGDKIREIKRDLQQLNIDLKSTQRLLTIATDRLSKLPAPQSKSASKSAFSLFGAKPAPKPGLFRKTITGPESMEEATFSPLISQQVAAASSSNQAAAASSSNQASAASSSRKAAAASSSTQAAAGSSSRKAAAASGSRKAAAASSSREAPDVEVEAPGVFELPFYELDTEELNQFFEELKTNDFFSVQQYMACIRKLIIPGTIKEGQIDCIERILNAFYNIEVYALANGGSGQKGGLALFDRGHFQSSTAVVLVDNQLQLDCSQLIAKYITKSVDDVVLTRPTESAQTTFIADTNRSGNVTWENKTVKPGGLIGAHICPIKYIALFIQFLKKYASEECKKMFDLLDAHCTVLPTTSDVNRDDAFMTRTKNGLSYLILVARLYNLEKLHPGFLKCICDTIYLHGDDALRCIILWDTLLGSFEEESAESADCKQSKEPGIASAKGTVDQDMIYWLSSGQTHKTEIDTSQYQAIIFALVGKDSKDDNLMGDVILAWEHIKQNSHLKAQFETYLGSFVLHPSSYFESSDPSDPFKGAQRKFRVRDIAGPAKNKCLSLPAYYRAKGNNFLIDHLKDHKNARRYASFLKLKEKRKKDYIEIMEKLRTSEGASHYGLVLSFLESQSLLKTTKRALFHRSQRGSQRGKDELKDDYNSEPQENSEPQDGDEPRKPEPAFKKASRARDQQIVNQIKDFTKGVGEDEFYSYRERTLRIQSLSKDAIITQPDPDMLKYELSDGTFITFNIDKNENKTTIFMSNVSATIAGYNQHILEEGEKLDIRIPRNPTNLAKFIDSQYEGFGATYKVCMFELCHRIMFPDKLLL